MNRTNSNSITSLLVVALNEESEFRTQTLDLLSKKIRRKISNEVCFYDCTHSPLLYKQMNGTEIDIIARIPGKHKPEMMIEVKAAVGETLQDSQSIGGEYENTSKDHNIPLVYIIPKNYIHKEELPKIAVKIYWENLLSGIENFNVKFDQQIRNFVEINDEIQKFRDEEQQLFSNKSLLKSIYCLKQNVIQKIYDLLFVKFDRQKTGCQEDEWGVGYYYKFKGTDCFIGFNPFDDDKFLSMAIAENVKNIELGDRKDNPLYFYEGWYYNSILNNNCLDVDEKVLSSLREQLSGLVIEKDVKTNFFIFFALRSKVISGDFDKIFDDEGNINDKEYENLKKKIG